MRWEDSQCVQARQEADRGMKTTGSGLLGLWERDWGAEDGIRGLCKRKE